MARRKYNRRARQEHGNQWRHSKKKRSELRAACAAQDGRCAICGAEKPLVGDHNHETGQFRAMLCGQCNVMIGMAHENPEVLLAAVAYLAKHL